MMSSKDGVGQVIKACVTVVALIALTGRFRVINATLDDVFGLPRGTHDAVGPAQLTNRLITLDIIDEILDVDLHGWTPVRARGRGCRQYTPSSNATTLESKTPGSPIFKAVQKKWCTAWCRVLKNSPKPPESAVGEGSEPSYVDRSVGAP